MQPSEFWECTLLDIGHYLVGNYNRKYYDDEKEKMYMYKLAYIIADMNEANIRSIFSKSGNRYKKFEEYFPNDKNENKSKTNGDKYDVINEKNKYEFLHKQKIAYEKMGIKFDS